MTSSVAVQAKKYTMYIHVSTRLDIWIGGDKLQRSHVCVHVHCTVHMYMAVSSRVRVGDMCVRCSSEYMYPEKCPEIIKKKAF